MQTLDPIVLGWDHANDRAAMVPLPGHNGAHWLIGGASGGGKSQAIHATLAQLAEREHMAIAINDAALMDYVDWSPRVSSMALGKRGGGWLLEQAEREMHRRLRLGREMGVKSLDRSIGPDLPYIVYVFDELAMLMLAAEIKGAQSRLVEVAQVFRKTAQGLVLATQHPGAKVIPTMVSGQCPVRLCLRTKASEATEAILESRSRWPAHELPYDTPGVGFAQLPSGETVKVRVPYVGDDEIRSVAKSTAHLAPELPADRGWLREYDPYLEEDE